jgi:hypothetical protein
MDMVVRLVEHEPAWDLHLYLRALDIPYIAEYSPAPIGLGRRLPVLVIGEDVCSGHQIYQHRTIKTKAHNQTIDQFLSAYLENNLVAVFNQLLKVRNDHITTERKHGDLLGGLVNASAKELSAFFAIDRYIIFIYKR